MKWVLITYDVSTSDNVGRNRLRKVAKICESYGHRVQNSVFECQVSDKTLCLLREQLISVINKKEDSLRVYILGIQPNIEHYGLVESLDMTDSLLI